MKTAAALLAVLVVVLALCAAAGFVEFTYLVVVPNQPLLHPQKVVEISRTNIVLESGRVLALSPPDSEPLPEEVFLEVSNQVRRSNYEIDVEPKKGHVLSIYVRWPKKYRDYGPLFTIPIIRKTVPSSYRKRLTYGSFIATDSQPDGSANQW